MTKRAADMTDVMISYSRKDVEFAKQLHAVLTNDKRDVWMDWEDIPKTADWWREIKDGIEKADNFLYIISPDSVNSEVCGWEIDHAIALKKRLIPVLRREVTDDESKAKMNPALNAHNWVFARETDDFNAVYKQIITAMDTDLEHVKTHTRLLERALEWDRANRDKSFLLQGSDLQAASTWVTGVADKKPIPDNLHKQFIGESQRVATARRRNFIAATAFTVIVLTLAGIAIWQAVRADNARQLAVSAQQEAQALALASDALVVYGNDDLDRAIALALEAMKQGNGRPEAERALSTVAYTPGTRTFIDLGMPTTAAVMSPDAQVLLAANDEGKIYRVNTANPNERQELTGHTQAVTALTYNQIGNAFLSSSLDGTLRLWDATTYETVKTIETGQIAPHAIISPNGLYAVSNSARDSSLIVWSLETGEGRPLIGHATTITALAFSRDSSQIATGDQSGVIRVWEVTSGTVTSRLDTHALGLEESTQCLVFNQAGDTLYICGAERASTVRGIYAWQVGSDTLQRPERLATIHSEPITALAISPNGRQLMTGSADNHAFVWNATSLLPENALHGQRATIITVGFDLTGKQMMVGAANGTFRLWDTDHGALIRSIQSNDIAIWDMVFSPDGQYVIANNSLGLIDAATGAITRTFQADGEVNALSFNPSGDRLAAGLSNGTIILWDVATGEEVQRLNRHTASVWTLLFTKDGKKLLSASDDQTVRVWDTNTWAEVQQYPHTSRVWALALSPDNKLFATGTTNGDITLWDFTSTTPVRVMDRGNDSTQVEVLDLDFSPDGKKLVSGESDNHARIWDVATGELVLALQGHHGKVAGVAYSLDGRYLITGAYDNQVLMWETTTYSLARAFIGHTTAVSDVTISPNGKTLVSGSLTGNLRLWYVHSTDELVAWTLANRYVIDLGCDPIHGGHLTNSTCN